MDSGCGPESGVRDAARNGELLAIRQSLCYSHRHLERLGVHFQGVVPARKDRGRNDNSKGNQHVHIFSIGGDPCGRADMHRSARYLVRDSFMGRLPLGADDSSIHVEDR